MDITRRLERTARTVARRTRSATGPSDPAQADFARVLDGRHLWFAVPAHLGSPVLLDPGTGGVVANARLPSSTYATDDAAHRSARWVVDDVLPLQDGAQLLLAAEADGRVQRVRAPSPARDSGLRTPLTPDGRWRLLVDADDDGWARVCRRSRPAGALLVDVTADDGGITLRLLIPGATQALATLVLLDKDDSVSADLGPLTAPDDAGVRLARLTADRLPDDLGQHRVAVVSDQVPLVVSRHPDDAAIPDASGVLLPPLVDGPDDEVLARLAWTRSGVLQVRAPGGSRRT